MKNPLCKQPLCSSIRLRTGAFLVFSIQFYLGLPADSGLVHKPFSVRIYSSTWAGWLGWLVLPAILKMVKTANMMIRPTTSETAAFRIRPAIM